MCIRNSRPERLLVLVALTACFLLRGGFASAASFPLALRTAGGVVTIRERPTRIVSLSPSATQDLYAVGAGTQVVAVDSYSSYPPQAPRTSLSPYTPNVEAIAKYNPDLVIVAEDSDNVVAQLARLDIPVLVEPAAANLDGAYAEIGQIGAATGHAVAAAGVVAGLRRQVAAIVASVPKPRVPLSVYLELDQTFYSASSHTFIGQVLALLGLHNIADKASGAAAYPQLSEEYILASDPDLIVLADTVCCGQSEKTVAARPGWDTITAVKSGAVLAVNDSIASQWGPRVVLFLRDVAAAVRQIERRQ
jgi:iron complex transport system substrate-binding protein